VAAFVEGIGALTQEVSRQTERLTRRSRPSASAPSPDPMIETAQQIDAFVASLPLSDLAALPPERKSSLAGLLAGPVQGLLEGLHAMVSVAEQVEELGGGYTPGIATLADAIGRLEAAFADLGVRLAQPRQMSIVIHDRASTEQAPSFIVANVTRVPELEPLVTKALRDATVQALEPGVWYAELDRYPGVWADGASAEEALATLGEVLHEWLLIKIAHGDRDIPLFR